MSLLGHYKARFPIGVSSVPTILRPNSTPLSLAAVNPLPFFQPPPVNTSSNTVSSITVPVLNPQNLTMLPQVQPFVTPATTRTQVNIPASHIIENLSAWTFPGPSSFPTVHAAVPQPVRGQVLLASTSAAPIVTTTGVFTPVLPIQSRERTFYCNPPATTLPTTTLPIPQSTTAPMDVPFPTFPTTVQSTVPLQRQLQLLAQVQTAAKKPSSQVETITKTHWHEWTGRCKSAIDSASLSLD